MQHVSYHNMEYVHASNKPKGFLLCEFFTPVLSVIRATRFMSDVAVRCASALSITPRIFLAIIAYILFVVAKNVSGHTRAILNYASVTAFLAAVWQDVLAEIAKDVSAWA